MYLSDGVSVQLLTYNEIIILMKGLKINANGLGEHKINEGANNRLHAFLFSILEIDSAG